MAAAGLNFEQELALRKQPSARRFSDSDIEADLPYGCLPYTSEQVAAIQKWMNAVLHDEEKNKSVEDFFENLRDGTRLCNLLNHIHPEKVIDESKMTTREQIEEKGAGRATVQQCTTNIKLFTVARDIKLNIKQQYPFSSLELLKCCDEGSKSNRTLVVQSMYELAVKLYNFAKYEEKIQDIAAIDHKPFQVADGSKNGSKNAYVVKSRVSNGPKGGSAGRRAKKNGFKTAKKCSEKDDRKKSRREKEQRNNMLGDEYEDADGCDEH